eukprot:COSAG01_NODE_18857_length_1048_cov_8.005269_1_plen_31_part_10
MLGISLSPGSILQRLQERSWQTMLIGSEELP